MLSYVSLGLGLAGVGFTDLLHPSGEQWETIRVSRLPRLIAVILAGASLAVAGLIMQRITGNPFVSPSTSGTVEAAVLGLTVGILAFPAAGLMAQLAFAIAAAIVGTAVFLAVLRTLRHNDPLTVALVGLMFGSVLGAAATFLAFQQDLMQLIDIWTTGSGAALREGTYEPIYLVLAIGVVGYLFADRFTVVGMGQDVSVNLGVSYRTVMNVGLVVVSMMAAVVVLVVGAIPFLGLIVPNLVSMFLGDNVRRVLPVTAVAGATFVLACDILGRLLRYPYEVPLSLVAGLLGALVFVWLILRAAKGQHR